VIKDDNCGLILVTVQRRRRQATSAWSTENCSCFRSTTVASPRH